TSSDDAREQLLFFPVKPSPFHREMTREIERICLVRNEDGVPTHFIWGEEIPGDAFVGVAAKPITLDMCVTDTTPAIDLIRRFASSATRFCFVLTGAELSGYVTVEDLFRPELSICFL